MRSHAHGRLLKSLVVQAFKSSIGISHLSVVTNLSSSHGLKSRSADLSPGYLMSWSMKMASSVLVGMCTAIALNSSYNGHSSTVSI